MTKSSNINKFIFSDLCSILDSIFKDEDLMKTVYFYTPVHVLRILSSLEEKKGE